LLFNSSLQHKLKFSIFESKVGIMNLQAEKIELAKLLPSTDNPKVIVAIKNIFKKEKVSDFWDELSPQQQQEIKEATEQIKHGMTVDYDAFIASHK